MIGIFLGIALFTFTAHATPTPPARFLVVIDPGHGGQDHGAQVRHDGKVFEEKDLTLELSREVAQSLKGHRVRSILTRTVDKSISLTERTAIANRLRANVFISIHMNSYSDAHSNTEGAEGIETYILNTATHATSQRLADLENSVLEGSTANQNQKSDVNLIVKDLMLGNNLKQSHQLACAIQRHTVSAVASPRNFNRKNRGVKQALFYVLLGADMPSVLLEAGFINNAADRALIVSPSGRKRLAKAITQAVLTYQSQKNDSKSTKLANCLVH